MHALLIDDNTTNLQVLKMLMEEHGWHCTTITQPAQLGFELVHLDPIDLVFLDLEMPGANGYDVLNYLRANSRFANVPIIANTVHVSEINTVYEHGFQGFIGKPIDPDRFPDQLARIMNGEAVWEAT